MAQQPRTSGPGSSSVDQEHLTIRPGAGATSPQWQPHSMALGDGVQSLDSATISMGMSQINTDVRGLRADFNATLGRIEPILLSITDELTSLRVEAANLAGKVSGLPGKFTIWGAVIAVILGVLALGAPKEAWLAVLEYFNVPVVSDTSSASPPRPGSQQ